MTPEGEILAHLKKECGRLGLRCVRLSFGPGNETGWMDTIVLGPEGCRGEVMWIETKAPGKPLKPIQAYRRDEVMARGGMYCKPDTKEQVTAELEYFHDLLGIY